MAISITSTEIKARLHISVSTYDTDITAIIADIKDGLTGAIDTTAIVTYEAACELGMRDVIAGEVLNYLRRQPGYADALSAGGLSLGAEVESGDKLVERGLAILAPFTVAGYAETDLAKSKTALEKALNTARQANASQLAAAELLEAQNKAAKLASEKSKLDSEELKTDAETALTTAKATTEASQPAKIAADAAMSTGMAAFYNAQAALNAARLARMNTEDASIAADVAQGITGNTEGYFSLDSEEYD